MLSLTHSISSSYTCSISSFHSNYKIHCALLLNSKRERAANFLKLSPQTKKLSIKCSEVPIRTHKTCKNCKTQFDPALNHPCSCRFHTAHFGGETKRKFESVYTGGTMSTPDGGQVFQYWHCCGSEDPFDPGCTSAPHMSYDD